MEMYTVIDAQDDLEHGQGDQADPGLRAGELVHRVSEGGQGDAAELNDPAL